MCLKDFDQTKRIHHRPWCEHDAYALSWVIIKPQAMVEAKATHHHGDTGLPQFCGMEGDLGPGAILRRIMYHSKSRNKILLELVWSKFLFRFLQYLG
jgi:hypothetical protein